MLIFFAGLTAVVIVAMLSRDHDLSASEETIVTAEMNFSDAMIAMLPERIHLSRPEGEGFQRPDRVRAASEGLLAEGFTMVEADTGTIDLPVTKVIYNPDDPNALAVAQAVALYLGNAVVEASGPSVPALTTGTWAPGSSVIVLLGDDLAGKTLAQIAGQNSSTTTTASLAPPVTV